MVPPNDLLSQLNRPLSGSLAVVSVTYNSAGTIGGMLDSLQAGLAGVPRSEVVIADNASSDDSAHIAQNHPIGARVIRTGYNGGYAAGINAALATIDPQADVIVLNPDIRLAPGAAFRLLAPLGQARIGVTVPKIRHENGSLFHSLRREPSLLTAWADALLGSRLGAALDWGEAIHNQQTYQNQTCVDWASGCALAISAAARRASGPWDESYFLYSEEVDYQRRVRRAGFQIAYIPQAEFTHLGGDYQSNDRLYALLTANRVRDYARHHDLLHAGCFRLAVLSGELLRSLAGSPIHRAGVKAALSRLPLRDPLSPIASARVL